MHPPARTEVSTPATKLHPANGMILHLPLLHAIEYKQFNMMDSYISFVLTLRTADDDNALRTMVVSHDVNDSSNGVVRAQLAYVRSGHIACNIAQQRNAAELHEP